MSGRMTGADMEVSDNGQAQEPPLKKGPGVQYNVPVKNAFDILGEASRRKDRAVYEEVAEPRAKRMPPITVPPVMIVNGVPKKSPDTTTLRKMIQEVTTDFNLMFSEKGTIIFVEKSESFQKVVAFLKKKIIGHYTHPLERNKFKRFVLYGLQKLESETIMELVREKGLYPDKISAMTTSNPRYTDQCNYILYFQGTSTITLSSLKEVKAIFHTVVHWAHYKPKKSGVSPCRNCCLFGHGAENCGMSPNCTICAGPHNYKSCKFLLKKQEGQYDSISQKHIKCYNCGGNHTATYPECPKRLEYIDTMKATRESRRSNRPDNRPVSRPARPPPVIDESSFPQPVFGNPNYAPQRWTTSNGQPVQQPATQSNPNNTTPGLFSINECQTMLNDLFNALQGCQCKQDQAKVIADYAFKYFCKFP